MSLPNYGPLVNGLSCIQVCEKVLGIRRLPFLVNKLSDIRYMHGLMHSLKPSQVFLAALEAFLILVPSYEQIWSEINIHTTGIFIFISYTVKCN